MKQYTLVKTLELNGEEVDAKVVVNYTPGSVETGCFGPPENYDPGEPADLEFVSITVGEEEQLDFMSNATLLSIESAIEEEVAERAAMEERYEWDACCSERRAYN